MDEPTNHLDLASILALQEALSEFKGCVIIISHDQRFLRGICKKYWALGNRQIRGFEEFESARHWVFKQCKPVDCLPREFATVVMKEARFKGESLNQKALSGEKKKAKKKKQAKTEIKI